MKKTIVTPVIMFLWVITIIYISISYVTFEQLGLAGQIEKEMAARLGVEIIYKGITIASIMSVVVYIVLGKIIKEITLPMEKLTNEAKAFAKGEYIYNVKNYNIEEVQLLAQAFDDMGEKLYRTIRKLQYQKSKAESILNDLSEAIIILDEEGYVTEGNASVKDVIGIDDVKNHHILTLMRDAKATHMIEKAIKKNEYTSCEILKNKKILHMRIGAIAKGDKNYGFIISVRDITQTRQLEELRYQFVSNVT
ncbi:MAG: PAS domain S-box protein, partial [Niameybacter sp.]